MNKTVELVNGKTYTIQYGGEVVCGICSEEYDLRILKSYCDQTLECACDSGDSLITV